MALLDYDSGAGYKRPQTFQQWRLINGLPSPDDTSAWNLYNQEVEQWKTQNPTDAKAWTENSTGGVFGAGGGNPFSQSLDALTADSPVPMGTTVGWAEDPNRAFNDIGMLTAAGIGAGFLPGGAAAGGASGGATAAGGGLTAEAAGSTAAMTPEAYAAGTAAGYGTTGTAASVEMGTLGTTAAAEAAGSGATTMPLNTVEGYTAGTSAGTNTAATGFDWGQWAESLNNPQSLLAIGSGIAGIVQGNQQQDQATLAAAAANPWGTSGGRALADTQLQSLMRDPMQTAATDPSYQLRIQGAQRAMGAYGQDSGAMSIAGANASTDWYNQRLEQLSKLAGAGFDPANAGTLQQTGYQQGVNTIGQGLGSFGYAAAPTAQTLPQG